MKEMFTKFISGKTKYISIFGLFAGITGYNSVKTIPANHIGLYDLFGNISQNTYNSGIHILNPFIKLRKISLLSEKCCTTTKGVTNEGLYVDLSINTIYHIDYNRARDVYLKYKDNYVEIIVRPLIQSTIKTIISEYEAKALYNDISRQEIQKKLKANIVTILLNDGIVVDDILIDDVTLPRQLVSAIESKLMAEQERARIDFTLDKQRQEIQFMLEKEEMEAKRKKIEADGIKTFQDIVTQGISDKLIQWKSVEATKELASSYNSKIVIIGNKDTNGLPIMLGANN